LTGKILAAIFVAEVIIDMMRSGKAGLNLKILWSVIFLAGGSVWLVLFKNILLPPGVAILANAYFYFVRKYFFTRVPSWQKYSLTPFNASS
jgi:hypothetical protein